MPLLCLKDPQRCLLVGFCSGELWFSVFTCLSLQFEKWGQPCALWPSCCFFSLFSFLFVVWMKWQFLSSFFVCFGLFVSLSSLHAGLEAESPSRLPYFPLCACVRACAHTYTPSLFIYLRLPQVLVAACWIFIQRVACRAPGLPSCGVQPQQ